MNKAIIKRKKQYIQYQVMEQNMEETKLLQAELFTMDLPKGNKKEEKSGSVCCLQRRDATK